MTVSVSATLAALLALCSKSKQPENNGVRQANKVSSNDGPKATIVTHEAKYKRQCQN